MTFFKKATTTVAALAISMGLSAGVIAQDAEPVQGTGDVRIQVIEQEDAALTVSIGDLSFGQIEYSLNDQPVSGTIVVNAGDTRGTGDGWSVTLNGTDFQAETFEISNLSLVNPQVETTSTTGHPTERQPDAQSAAPVATAPGTILTAAPGNGAGNYAVTYQANLNVPAGTLVGEYESTLTVTISGQEPGAPDASGEGDD